jgi:hypothetical protein
MTLKLLWLISSLNFFCKISVFAQTSDSALAPIINTWNRYADHRMPDLFLHLDKSLYSPNEHILFTAYLLEKGSDTAVQSTLYIVLIDLAEKKVVVSDRFFMKEGISSGSLFIPDTLENGEYLLMAYTNFMRKGSSAQFFREQIGIRSGVKPVFNMAVSISPKNFPREDSIGLVCRIGTDYGGLASGGIFQFTVLGDGQLLQSGQKIIDPFGETHIVLPMTDTLAKAVIQKGAI